MSAAGTARVAAADACAECGFVQTVSIEVSDGRGGPKLTMTCCSRCDHHQWTRATGKIAASEALLVLSGRASFTLVPGPGQGHTTQHLSQGTPCACPLSHPGLPA